MNAGFFLPKGMNKFFFGKILKVQCEINQLCLDGNSLFLNDKNIQLHDK